MVSIGHVHPRRRRARPDFVAKTIVGVVQAIERAVYTEAYARRPGLLQQADPRAKLAVFVLAVLVVGLSRSLPVLIGLYAVAMVLGSLSKLPVDLLVKRILVGVPLFAGVVAFPALVTGSGRPLVDIATIGPLHLAITENSLLTVATFMARVTTSVTLAVLLVVTTRWSDLLKALRVFHVPEVFIVVLGMTYRYIFLLLRAVENLFLARSSRTVGATQEHERRRWIGASVGTLLSKSFKTSNDVYQAMVARGFTGEVRTMTNFRMRDEDWLLVSLSVVVLAGALLVDMRVV